MKVKSQIDRGSYMQKADNSCRRPNEFFMKAVSVQGNPHPAHNSRPDFFHGQRERKFIYVSLPISEVAAMHHSLLTSLFISWSEDR